MAKNKTKRQSYQYKKDESIVFGIEDDYKLTEREYYLLYNFFVTYSMVGSQSSRKRKFVDYGWKSNNLRDGIKHELDKVCTISDKNKFSFDENESLRKLFLEKELTDGPVHCDKERGVIAKTPSAKNQYFKLFYRIRDALAHGSFSCKCSTDGVKMLVMQDQDGTNVTARMVIKLETLLNIINVIDKNKILIRDLCCNKEHSTKSLT